MQGPGEGIHAHRTGGLATVDVALTIASAVIIAMAWSRWTSNTPFGAALVVSLAALFALGIVVHAALGIRTALNTFLGI